MELESVLLACGFNEADAKSSSANFYQALAMSGKRGELPIKKSESF
jgi:hypothetical protein